MGKSLAVGELRCAAALESDGGEDACGLVADVSEMCWQRPRTRPNQNPATAQRRGEERRGGENIIKILSRAITA